MQDDAQRLIDEGYAARRDGDVASALDRYQAAVKALRTIDAPERLAHTIRHVADIQRKLNLSSTAEANYAEALALYRAEPATGKLDLANALRGYALLREDTGDLAAARAMWLEARELYRALALQPGVDESRRHLEML